MARIGVGVGLGKIEYQVPVIPGSVVRLPKIPVVNTGEEEGSVVVKIDYFGDQKELQPPAEWFSFSPQKIYLKAGESRMVSTSMKLPFTPISGKYLALLEAQYVGGKDGQVRLGPAAATKFYFTIGESPGVLGAAVQRVKTLSYYYPLWMLILAGFFFLSALNILRKNFKISLKIGVKRKAGGKSMEKL